MIEAWRSVPGYEGRYEVSSIGRVRNSAGRVLKLYQSSDGYPIVGLPVDGRMRNRRVHRLVAMAFLGDPAGDRNVVNHIDFDKTNNVVSNLEWVTPAENVRHTIRAGRLVPPVLRGEKGSRAKLTQAQVDVVRRLRGVVGQRDLATLCGVSKSAIQFIHQGVNWPEAPRG